MAKQLLREFKKKKSSIFGPYDVNSGTSFYGSEREHYRKMGCVKLEISIDNHNNNEELNGNFVLVLILVVC